jgi:hypothetical protein
MKRIFVFVLALSLLLVGCTRRNCDVGREQIVEAYEAAGYNVSTGVYEQPLEYGQTAYIQANHPDGEYIYFTFFETEADAKAYKREFYHPVMMVLFSVIFGEPSWQRWEVYGCIVVEYDNSDYMQPFEKLLKGF